MEPGRTYYGGDISVALLFTKKKLWRYFKDLCSTSASFRRSRRRRWRRQASDAVPRVYHRSQECSPDFSPEQRAPGRHSRSAGSRLRNFICRRLWSLDMNSGQSPPRALPFQLRGKSALLVGRFLQRDMTSIKLISIACDDCDRVHLELDGCCMCDAFLPRNNSCCFPNYVQCCRNIFSVIAKD